MPTIEELETALNDAENNRYRLQRKKDDEIRDAVDNFREKTQTEVGLKYDADIISLQEKKATAHMALADAKTALALSGEGSEYPIGTILVEWHRRKYTSWSYGNNYILSGKKGIVQPVTKDFVHPANLSSYSRASTGTFVIRILKKDGTPGLQYEKLGSYQSKYWLPEGVIHPEAEEK